MSANNKSNTFVVQINYNQNNTWQGTVKWIDQRKEQCFRSTLELISLMDDAIKSSETEGTESIDE